MDNPANSQLTQLHVETGEKVIMPEAAASDLSELNKKNISKCTNACTLEVNTFCDVEIKEITIEDCLHCTSNDGN